LRRGVRLCDGAGVGRAMGAWGTDQIRAGEAGATAMVSIGKGLREEDAHEASSYGQRRAPERRGKGGARDRGRAERTEEKPASSAGAF
jgi:hypothetical protein